MTLDRSLGSLSVIRRAMAVIRVVLISALLATLALAWLAPRFGHQLVIIRGPSMEPTIPLGSLLVESPVDQARLVPGTVVTFTTSNGVIITHRIVDGPVAADPSRAASILTKGDNNLEPDPARVPVAAVTGIAEVTIPVAGWVLAWLQLPSGLISVISLLGCLIVLEWLADDLAAEAAEWATTEEPEADPAAA